MVALTDKNSTVIQKAVTLIGEGLFKEAIEELRAFLKTNPESIEGWYNLGYALTEIEELEEAVKAYDETLAKHHGFWVRKGVHMAVYTLPHREDVTFIA